MLIIQQLETRIGEQSEAMVVTADKEYRIYVVAYAFVIIFNFEKSFLIKHPRIC